MAAYFEKPSNPEFSEQMEKFETTETGHADTFNKRVEKLFHNDLALAKDMKEKMFSKKYGDLINKPIACVQYNVDSPGWYRIAYRQYTTRPSVDGAHNGYDQDPNLSCKIFIKRSYANYAPEVHCLYLQSVGTADFIRILSGGNTRVITKLRLVYNKVTGRHYLDFYYNTDKFNWVQFNISDNSGLNNSEIWSVYDAPQLVTETDSILLKEIDISQEFSVNYRSGRQITFDGRTIKLADFCALISDWNDATKNGWYMAANAANAPTEMAGWYYGIVIAHNENYVRQILYHFGNGDIIMSAACDRYERIKHNGTWGKWVNTSYRNLLSRTGGDMEGDIVFPNNHRIVQKQNSTSNYSQIAEWYSGGVKPDKEYAPQIGQWNTNESITILPYATDDSPWGGTVGLYIKKGIAKLDGVKIMLTNKESMNEAINTLDDGSTNAPIDGDFFIVQSAGTYLRKRLSVLWDYIKNKLETENTYAKKQFFNNGTNFVEIRDSVGQSVLSKTGEYGAIFVSVRKVIDDTYLRSASFAFDGDIEKGSNGFMTMIPVFRPSGSGEARLGNSNNKWKEIYAETSTISTSDKNEKKDIKVLDDNQTIDFIMGLKPKSYKFINGDSGRTHTGLIAQDIEELLESLNMSTLDFAGFIKSSKTKTVEKEIEQEVEEDGKIVVEKTIVSEEEIIEGEYIYGLRYEEFISPLIKMVQIQQKKINLADERLSALEKENAELKEKVGNIESALEEIKNKLDM